MRVGTLTLLLAGMGIAILDNISSNSGRKYDKRLAIVRDDEDGGRDPSEKVCGVCDIGIIRLNIFRCLSSKDLFECRRVCHAWNKQSEAELARRKCFVHVTGGCKAISKLNDFVHRTRFSLFSGLSIEAKDKHDCYSWLGCKAAKKDCKYLMTAQLRYIKVRAKPCVALGSFLHCILEGNSATIEEVEIYYEVRDGEIEAPELLADPLKRTFPKLRQIKICPTSAPPYDAFELANAAPNLQKIVGRFDMDELERLSTAQMRLLTSVDCAPFRGSSIELFPTIVDNCTNLEALKIEDAKRVIPAEWSLLLPKFLIQTSQTLQKLGMCAMELRKLATTGSCDVSLPTLQLLEIQFPKQTGAAHVMNFFGATQISQVCPNLSTVVLNFGDYCSHFLPPLVTNDFVAHLNVCVTSVREVYIEGATCPVAAIQMCSNLFPALTALEFEAACRDESCVGSMGHVCKVSGMWSAFSALCRLAINVSECTGQDTLDALLCGITKKEARRWRKEHVKQGGQHDQLHYCPIRPPLTYFTGIKLLRVVPSRGLNFDRYGFTELSGALSFARMQGLTVKLEVNPSLQFSKSNLPGCVETTLVENKMDW